MKKDVEDTICSSADFRHKKRKSHQRFLWTGGGTKRKLKMKRTDHDANSRCSSHRVVLSPSASMKCWNILHNLLVCALLLLCLSCQTVLSQTPGVCAPTLACFADSVNLALPGTGRSLDVSTTCGTPAITTYKKDTQTLDTTTLYYCDANNVTISHPKEYMVDLSRGTVALNGNAPVNYTSANAATYWQSLNSRTVVNGNPTIEWIVLNLTEPFLIRYMRIIYVSPHINSTTVVSDMRPKALCIEHKRFQNDTEWMPLRYYAQDCPKSFPTVQYLADGQTSSPTTPVCIQKYYANDRSTDVGYGLGRQEVIFDPSKEYSNDFEALKEVMDHYSMSMVRIRMVEPANTAAESSYYAIANLGVWGLCSCYGHASKCTGAYGSGCQCGHNTQGTNCESCLPLFNNKPWAVGKMCETCACLEYRNVSYADSCTYNAVKGFGVCNSCKLNTEGDKCNQCSQGYYQNPGVTNANITYPAGEQCQGDDGKTATANLVAYDCNSYCIPCNCSRAGSNANRAFDCNRLNGQCFCKQYVTGRMCDECQDEYWNLQTANPTGCQACNCDRSGTFNNTNLCDKVTGNCICKTNVGGVTCNACKARNFGLSAAKADGCTPCDCDPGASTSLDCPVGNGQCSCRENIGGRNCKAPVSGRYVPKLDALTYDAEFGFNATNLYKLIKTPGHGEINGTVTGLGLIALPENSQLVIENVQVPKSLIYESAIRYSTAAAWAGVAFKMEPMNMASVAGQTFLCSNGNSIKLDEPLQSTFPVPESKDTVGSTKASLKCLREMTPYRVTITTGASNPVGQTLNLDSLVFLTPLTEINVYKNSDNATKAAMDKCYEAAHGVDLALRANLSCPAYGYSLMANLYNGATACRCDPDGSSSLICNGQNGQCPCKPGVMLQDCSMCKVFHYGFGSGQGCTACNCDPQGSQNMDCNNQGVCTCKTNVIGNKCDQCTPGYWGRFTGNGCQLCNCNQQYSLNISCADTGQCYCKPGIGGRTCTECSDGFYELTVNGCTECKCDPKGSVIQMCNKTTGLCTCKAQATGMNCDQCKPGYFGLSSGLTAGCLKCFCSEHSTNCTAAPGWYASTTFNTWSLLDAATAIQERFSGVDNTGQPIALTSPTFFLGNDSTNSQLVMQITNDVASGNAAKTQLYYKLISKYLGDKRASYGRKFTFALSVKVPVNKTATDVPAPNGDLILTGKHVNEKMVARLPTIPTEKITVYSFDMVESTFQLNTATGGSVSYFQFMQVLADLDSILIRAKYKDIPDVTTTLYNVSLGIAVQNQAAGPLVTNVEQCVCPKEYTGAFCDKCASGYTRKTVGGGPFSECVPCECNKHNTVPCDPETGVCTCIHNTMGKTCDKCNPGYYGYPRGGTPFDCRPCLCPGNVVEKAINAFASTCDLVPGKGTFVCNNCTEGYGGDRCDQCQPNFYGVPSDPTNNQGKCVPCKCNGRATICNSTTGFCVDCKNNTAGKECDICAPKFHGGSPDTAPCQPCNCTNAGATGDCNGVTGECVCKPQVAGFRCDTCVTNTYNYSSDGCTPCNCSSIGSSSFSCNVTTGQCICSRPHAIGRRCDQCDAGYWNLNPQTGCNMCNCKLEGTLQQAGVATPPCTLIEGQCTCSKPGIVGRICDRCAPGTTKNFTYIRTVPAGTYPDCKLCGECFDDWATHVETTAFDIIDKYQKVLVIWTHYDNLTYEEVQPVLDLMDAQLKEVDGKIANVTDMFNQINQLGMGFVNMTMAANNLTVRLVGIAQDHSRIQNNLTALMSFSGIVPMQEANIQYSSPDIVDQTSKNIESDHNAKFVAANSSWANITRMTEAVNYNTQDYRDRVTAAMSKKSLADAEQAKAVAMVDGEYPTQYAKNTNDLKRIEAALQPLPEQIGLIQATITVANESLMNAQTTAAQADTIIKQKRAAADAAALLAQSVKLNATRAEDAVKMAQERVLQLKTLSDTNRGNMSANLYKLVEGFATLQNISSSLMSIDTRAAEITNIGNGLRSQALLQETTNQITNTALDTNAVQAASDAAAAALKVANEVQNITQSASIEANKSLEMIRAIDVTLAAATANQLTTNAVRLNVSNSGQQIQAVINSVQTKILAATQTGTGVDDAMTDVERSITTVKSCYVDKQVRAKAARLKAEPTVNTVNVASGIHTQNLGKVSKAQSDLESALQEAQVKYQGLSGVQQDFQTLKNDMGSIGGTQDINALLNEYLAQQSELNSLNNDLTLLSTESDTLEARVIGLESDLVSC